MNIKEYAKREALRVVGIPILASELTDTLFTSEVLEPALYDYYIIAPFEWNMEYKIRGAGNTTIPIPDLKTAYEAKGGSWPNENPAVEADFVGLLGFNFGVGPPSLSPYSNNKADNIYQILDSQLEATIFDETLGDACFQYDPIAKSYNVFCPSNGTLGITLGYRLSSFSFIKPSHAPTFAKIVTRKFLELLVAGRSSVVISGDVTMDITAIQTKLDALLTSYERDMYSITTPFVTWG